MPRETDWLDIATAALLSVAGLASAWAGYQSSLWGGQQARAYTLATGAVNEASDLELAAGQQDFTDRVLFVSWLNAAAINDTARMRFFERRFTPEMRAPFAAWQAQLPADVATLVKNDIDPGLPALKFVHPEAQKAAARRAEARAYFGAGDTANGNSDRYGAAAALLALVLFLAGISPIVQRRPAKTALMVLAAVLCVAGVAWVAGLPRATL